jgi:2-polyprenyl-3-methyl-5-hydroxy-6-metoxy-1,4-benzoquinol methylase
MSTRWTPQQCKTATEELKTDIFSFLPDLNDKRVLDVGCGIGRFTDDL